MLTRRPRPRGSYQLTTHVAVILLLLVMFIAAGYYLLALRPEPASTVGGLLPALQSARETWAAQRPRRFRYVVERKCDCPAESRTPFVVTEEGAAVTARYSIPLEAANGDMLTGPSQSLSIMPLFDIVEQAIRQDNLSQVDYDANYGYPALVQLDTAASEAFEIRDFEVLEYR